jgi:hypothetical protein
MSKPAKPPENIGTVPVDSGLSSNGKAYGGAVTDGKFVPHASAQPVREQDPAGAIVVHAVPRSLEYQDDGTLCKTRPQAPSKNGEHGQRNVETTGRTKRGLGRLGVPKWFPLVKRKAFGLLLSCRRSGGQRRDLTADAGLFRATLYQLARKLKGGLQKPANISVAAR